MVELQNIEKRYGDFLALKGISFKAAEGQILGLLGPNGAGKSTIMKIISSFLRPSSGVVKVCGWDVLKDVARVRSCIGYLPEVPPLYPEMRVEDYLRFVAQIKAIERREIGGSVERVLEACSLVEQRKKICGVLSKGYKQRVGVAQAIVHRPPVVILDEPTSGLDPGQVLEMRALIEKLKKRTTLIISSHILSEIEELCDRVVVVSSAEVVLDESVSSLRERGSLEEHFREATAYRENC